MDTYTITFTNGNTTTFTVTNGNDGEKGDKGDKGDKGNTGNTGATGNGISTVAKTGTSGLVDTYTITFTNGTTTTFTVTNGADGTVPIVTSWESTLSDSKVPSEKLTKNALDGKQATLVSGTNLKTINNESLLGSGNITVAPQIDIQTSWGNPTSDSKVASEKLIKDSLDGKLDNTIGSSAVTIASDDNIVITDTSDSNKVKKVANLLASQVKDGTAHSNIGSSANDTQATINSDIDTALSNKISKSSTSGLLKNDGSVDTTSYSTFDGNYNNLTNKPTIPSASSTTPSADTTSGSYGSGTSYARSNHTHPKSSLYAESSHTHTKSQITDFPSLSTVATSGSYSDLSNKPSIPSSSSDLSDGSDLVKKSSTDGVILNDGSIAQLRNIDGQELFSTYGDTDVITFHHYFRIYDFFIKKNWDNLNTRPTVDDYVLVWENGGYGLFNFTKYNVLPVEYEFEFRVTATSTISVYVNSTEIIDEGSSGTYTINIVCTNNVATVKVDGTIVATLNTAITSLALSSYAEFTINGNYVYYDTDFDACVRSSRVIEETALSNIGTSKGATQSEINSAIASAIANMLTTSDVVDNLTSTSATAPLSAKQGKVLNDMIGSAITYIIGSGS